MNKLHWMCILSPTVNQTREFIKSLGIEKNPKVKCILSSEDYFDSYDMFLRTTHMIGMINQFNRLIKNKEKPDIIISDYSFSFYLTQISEHTPITSNTHTTWQTLCLDFTESQNIPSVDEYIALNDILLNENSTENEDEEYLKPFAKDYLCGLPEEMVSFINHDINGLNYVRKKINYILSVKLGMNL